MRPPISLASVGWWLGAMLLVLAGAGPGGAQPVLTDLPVTAESRSGQFIVHGRASSLPAPANELIRIGTNQIITLRPDLLAVTAERVKLAVERRLGVGDRWRSRVHLQLREAARLDGPIRIQARVFRDGWQFYIPLPDRIEWERLIRALVEVVLLERANRDNTGVDCALVPLWLTEGMNWLVLAEPGRDLVAEASTVLNRSELKPDSLAAVRLGLRGREHLSFSDLSLASLDQLGDLDRFQEFQLSAALLTWEFLRFESGRALMREFLHGLPANLNWQTTLLRSSGGQFQTLLDVEKWWALSAAETLSVDPAQRWPRSQVLNRLDELAHEMTDIRADTNSPPVRRRVSLPELVTEWEFATQREVLLRKSSQWRSLSLRSPADLAQLCSEYAQVVNEYLRERERAGLGTSARGELSARANLIAAAAARRFAELNRRVETARNQAALVPTGALR